MRKIELRDIGNYSEEQINTLLSSVVLTADRIVKEGSPVDTGRLAVSWQIGENAESGAPAKEGKYGGKGLGTGFKAEACRKYVAVVPDLCLEMAD